MEEKEKATRFQIEQATELIQRLKYDLEWYALERMTRGQMYRLIDKLTDDARRLEGGRHYGGTAREGAGFND